MAVKKKKKVKKKKTVLNFFEYTKDDRLNLRIAKEIKDHINDEGYSFQAIFDEAIIEILSDNEG